MIKNMDAHEWLNSLESESIDLILTDPAYESIQKHRTGPSARFVSFYETISNEKLRSMSTEMYRVLKNDRHMYIMCDQETMFDIVPAFKSSGFKFWKPLIWDKVDIGLGYHYRSRYEVVLFFEKGKRQLSDMSIPDILRFKRVRGGYPTEKPKHLASLLISQSTCEGEVVADPFVGSGAFGKAAIDLGRKFCGSDISLSACSFATNRIGFVSRDSNGLLHGSPAIITDDSRIGFEHGDLKYIEKKP